MNDELAQVTALVCRLGKLGSVGPEEDFYEAGFSSVSALELLLELETAFGVSISDDDFIASRTPRALCTLVTRLRQEQLA